MTRKPEPSDYFNGPPVTEYTKRGEVWRVRDGGPWKGPTQEEWVRRIAAGSTPVRDLGPDGDLRGWTDPDQAGRGVTHFLAFLLGIASYHIALHALYRWIFRDNGTRQSGGGLDEMPDFV